MIALALAFLLQAAFPAPVGYVNDFAHVLDPAAVAHMDAVIAEVRDKTRGEIAVVTLPDIGDREAADVAYKIGREWGVGAKGNAGDPAKNLGVVILLVPRRDHRPGTGKIAIASGRGAEGFLTDARSGRIRDAMGRFLAQEAYGAGLAHGVDLVAQAFAQEFGVTLTGTPAVQEPGAAPGASLVFKIILILIFLLIFSRRRLGFLPIMFGGFGGPRGGGWGGGGGGGFGGGFGGFGGGGGFSGGGAGGRF